MTIYERGEVILVPFPFSERLAAKRRPALIISSNDYNASCEDLLIAQITSRVDVRPRPGDYNLTAWKEAGLLAPSLVRARIATINKSLVIRRLGHLLENDLEAVTAALAIAVGVASAAFF